MTAPNRPSGDQNAAAKGIVLLVGVVLLGVILLARFGGSSGRGSANANSATTTTESAPTTSQVTIPTGNTAKSPTTLKIAVFNGTGGRITKAAGNTKAKLVASGYSASNISVNDTTPRTSSIVYYNTSAGQGDGAAVANALGLPASSVAAVGSATLPAGTSDSDVIVIVGSDATSNPAISGGTGTSGTGTSGTGTSGTSGTSGSSGTSGRSGTSGSTTTTH